jgi:hypothetical protein
VHRTEISQTQLEIGGDSKLKKYPQPTGTRWETDFWPASTHVHVQSETDQRSRQRTVELAGVDPIRHFANSAKRFGLPTTELAQRERVDLTS